MYSVRIIRRAMRDLSNLPQQYADLLSQHIDSLSENPRPRSAKRLQGRTDYSLRVGDYRIIYEIDDRELLVTIYRVKHRLEAYR
ncbi:MAG: type II toxin-antitoxin system RelE/ParE family toxin [Gemmatimonadetes bacterium]|nr:type II toxin-antitoxin system RelE/ParE family toxin [Gemmatimonadota bacterium]